MKVPRQYEELRTNLGFDAIEFDVGGIALFTVDELEEYQAGYSRAVDGSSLCDGETGSWQENWLVIGCETAMGDPIILDISSPNLSVLCAAHGEGVWEPGVISASLTGFLAALQEFRIVAEGRGGPLLLEENPLTPSERNKVLDRICRTDAEADRSFWENVLYIDDNAA